MENDKLKKKIKSKYKNLIPYKVYITNGALSSNGMLSCDWGDLFYKNDVGDVFSIDENINITDMFYDYDLPKITSKDRILNKLISSDYIKLMDDMEMELIDLPSDKNKEDLYFCIVRDAHNAGKNKFMNYKMFIYKYDGSFLEYDDYHEYWKQSTERILAWVRI
jgi:hypothetical protein